MVILDKATRKKSSKMEKKKIHNNHNSFTFINTNQGHQAFKKREGL